MRQVKKDKRREDWLKNLETKYEGHKPRTRYKEKRKETKEEMQGTEARNP
jgi:hypothetical protein